METLLIMLAMIKQKMICLIGVPLVMLALAWAITYLSDFQKFRKK